MEGATPLGRRRDEGEDAMNVTDRIVRIIRARCSDVLAPSDLDLVEAALNSSYATVAISSEVAERIAEVLDALDERLAATESRLDRTEESA
jgi:hypothetical protein